MTHQDFYLVVDENQRGTRLIAQLTVEEFSKTRGGVSADTKSVSAYIFIHRLKIKDLVNYHNLYAEKQIKKFRDLGTGRERLAKLLKEKLPTWEEVQRNESLDLTSKEKVEFDPEPTKAERPKATSSKLTSRKNNDHRAIYERTKKSLDEVKNRGMMMQFLSCVEAEDAGGVITRGGAIAHALRTVRCPRSKRVIDRAFCLGYFRWLIAHGYIREYDGEATTNG